MTTKLVKILEAAKFYYDRSMRYFEYYERDHDEDDWNWSKENDCKCRGALEAYNILTDSHIMPFEIKHELETVKKRQDMREFVKDAMDEYEELGIACLL